MFKVSSTLNMPSLVGKPVIIYTTYFTGDGKSRSELQ